RTSARHVDGERNLRLRVIHMQRPDAAESRRACRRVNDPGCDLTSDLHQPQPRESRSAGHHAVEVPLNRSAAEDDTHPELRARMDAVERSCATTPQDHRRACDCCRGTDHTDGEEDGSDEKKLLQHALPPPWTPSLVHSNLFPRKSRSEPTVGDSNQ